MNSGLRMEEIRRRLETAFSPQLLEITDDSAKHAGHAGAKSGKGHYGLVITARAFSGKAQLARHRMVYEALGEMMDQDIHALVIQANGDSEA